MRNKPRTPKEYIDYRNTLLTRRDARAKQGLKPMDGQEDYYTIRLKEIDEQVPEFKGIGKVRMKK